jgi:hypothetical protein
LLLEDIGLVVDDTRFSEHCSKIFPSCFF